jgi:hypothetical protein
VPVPHESQAPAQGVSQQTPTTQLPVMHWFTLVHAVPLPYLQSRSCPLEQMSPQGVQAVGQNPSAPAVHPRATEVQAKVQLATVPDRVRTLLLSLTQASDWAWQVEIGSHFSPDSTAPFPHVGVQSLSLLALQPVGQQESPLAHAEIEVVFTHLAVHACAVPCSARS